MLSVGIHALHARHALSAYRAALDGEDDFLLVDGGSSDGIQTIAAKMARE